MHFLLLTARPELETNRRLEASIEATGGTPLTVDATRVNASAGTAPGLWYGNRNLLDPVPNVVLARVGNWRPESVLAALEVATDLGIPTPNPPPAIRTGRDHWLTARALVRAGVATPQTMAGADPEALATAAERQLGLPVVVKQRRSRMGVGVILCRTRDHLESVLDSLWRVGDEVVAQRFIHTDGLSVRALVVGGRVVASARFRAPAGEWRSNGARGGTSEEWQLSAAENDLAVRAAAAVGLGLCGVDLLPGREGPVVGEVNPTPGFRHLERATGVDVAAAIVRHLAALADSS